ncbi:MAG: hypothetical protein ACE5JI_18900 [Acidobacteriota bacterium]
MKAHSAVVVSLHSPREKIWGLLLSIHTSGVTLKGIDLNSFEDWSCEVARGEATMGLSTMFFPMHRVERIHLDETVGGIQSLADIFASRVRQDLWSYLGVPPPSALEVSGDPTSQQRWRALEENEK